MTMNGRVWKGGSGRILKNEEESSYEESESWVGSGGSGDGGSGKGVSSEILKRWGIGGSGDKVGSQAEVCGGGLEGEGEQVWRGGGMEEGRCGNGEGVGYQDSGAGVLEEVEVETEVQTLVVEQPTLGAFDGVIDVRLESGTEVEISVRDDVNFALKTEANFGSQNFGDSKEDNGVSGLPLGKCSLGANAVTIPVITNMIAYRDPAELSIDLNVQVKPTKPSKRTSGQRIHTQCNVNSDDDSFEEYKSFPETNIHGGSQDADDDDDLLPEVDIDIDLNYQTAPTKNLDIPESLNLNIDVRLDGTVARQPKSSKYMSHRQISSQLKSEQDVSLGVGLSVGFREDSSQKKPSKTRPRSRKRPIKDQAKPVANEKLGLQADLNSQSDLNSQPQAGLDLGIDLGNLGPCPYVEFNVGIGSEAERALDIRAKGDDPISKPSIDMTPEGQTPQSINANMDLSKPMFGEHLIEDLSDRTIKSKTKTNTNTKSANSIKQSQREMIQKEINAAMESDAMHHQYLDSTILTKPAGDLFISQAFSGASRQEIQLDLDQAKLEIEVGVSMKAPKKEQLAGEIVDGYLLIDDERIETEVMQQKFRKDQSTKTIGDSSKKKNGVRVGGSSKKVSSKKNVVEGVVGDLPVKSEKKLKLLTEKSRMSLQSKNTSGRNLDVPRGGLGLVKTGNSTKSLVTSESLRLLGSQKSLRAQTSKTPDKKASKTPSKSKSKAKITETDKSSKKISTKSKEKQLTKTVPSKTKAKSGSNIDSQPKTTSARSSTNSNAKKPAKKTENKPKSLTKNPSSIDIKIAPRISTQRSQNDISSYQEIDIQIIPESTIINIIQPESSLIIEHESLQMTDRQMFVEKNSMELGVGNETPIHTQSHPQDSVDTLKFDLIDASSPGLGSRMAISTIGKLTVSQLEALVVLSPARHGLDNLVISSIPG
jgi:hypothetical protein